MILVKLTTKFGEFVTNVQVPPMQPMPEVIGWGSRIFVYVDDTQYKEGIIYFPPETTHPAPEPAKV